MSNQHEFTKPVTVIDIARRCGVHKSTVQRALSGDPQISPITTERIRLIAAEMGYDANHHLGARRLAFRKHGKQVMNRVIAAFFPPDFYQRNYFLEIFRGMLDVIAKEHYELSISVTIENDPLPHSVLSGEVDGVIAFIIPEFGDHMVQKLRTAPNFGTRPIVSLLFAIDGCVGVTTDEIGNAYQAAAHLLDLGHRHLLHFFHDDQPPNYQHSLRLQGLRLAYLDRGLAPDTFLHFKYGDWRIHWRERYTQPTLDALKQHPQTTAIVAPNDLFATAIADDLRAHGLRIPDDISLVGFDDTDPLYDAQNNNILTTVRLPLEELGREAVHLMLRNLASPSATPEQVILPSTLVVRGSTAAPRG
ncbi:MAG: LacI family DNA-binding transcriptional regulator [Armatimonadota bacterium]